jgi:hypothetical protein
MNHLDSLNIRKGLELEVPVKDIFAIKTLEVGDVLSKEICDLGWEAYSTINPELSQKVAESGGTIYSSEKKAFKISDSLTAYVYKCYIVDVQFDEENEKFDAITSVSDEIDFLNTEILDFDQFCFNIMQAQSFSGKYNNPLFKFSFYGYGSFSLNNYIDIHKIVALSNIHTLNFFINHKNVLSGISAFLNGLHRNDIVRQREYLTSKEFATLLNEAEMQFELISAFFSKNINQ